MARKLRVKFEGAIYHVVIRGVERRRLFDDDADRERFIGRLSKYAQDIEVRLYLFCVMLNHLLLETPGGNLGQYMHRCQDVRRDYGRYVELGLVKKDEELAVLKKQAKWGIGSNEFSERVQTLYEEKVRACRQTEDVSFRREQCGSLAVKEIVGVVGTALVLVPGWERNRRQDMIRAVGASMLCKYGGLSQRKVAGIIGVTTGAAVSIQLKRLEQARKMDKALEARVHHIEGILVGLRQKAKEGSNLSFKG